MITQLPAPVNVCSCTTGRQPALILKQQEPKKDWRLSIDL